MRRIIDSHPPGAFCWIELYTTDQNAAKSFYNSLFGWTANDLPMGPDDFYTMFQLEGRETGAACTLRPEQKAHGRAAALDALHCCRQRRRGRQARHRNLGGKVLAPPFDVSTRGAWPWCKIPRALSSTSGRKRPTAAWESPACPGPSAGGI